MFFGDHPVTFVGFFKTQKKWLLSKFPVNHAAGALRLSHLWDSLQFSIILWPLYSPEGAFLWSQVGGGANYHTFVNWKESNQAKRVSDEQCIMFLSFISPQATISGADRPRAQIFHNFWPNERDSLLRVFVGCKCKFCHNCSFHPAPKHGQSLTMGK